MNKKNQDSLGTGTATWAQAKEPEKYTLAEIAKKFEEAVKFPQPPGFLLVPGFGKYKCYPLTQEQTQFLYRFICGN